MASVLFQGSSSKSVINNILYGGANFVPIVVTRFCFKVFPLKVKILFLRKTAASSNNVEVVTYFSCLKSNHLRRAHRLSTCEMLRYKPATSTLDKVISSGKFSKEKSFFKKSLVPFK